MPQLAGSRVDSGAGEESLEDKVLKIKSMFGSSDSGKFAAFVQYSARLIETMMNESQVWGVPKNGRKSELRSCQQCTTYKSDAAYLKGEMSADDGCS